MLKTLHPYSQIIPGVLLLLWVNYLTAMLQYSTLPMPPPSELCWPLGASSQGTGKVQDRALPLGGKQVAARMIMC